MIRRPHSVAEIMLIYMASIVYDRVVYTMVYIVHRPVSVPIA